MKFIKSLPEQGIYYAEETVETGSERSTIERNVINVYDDVAYQTVVGFGGSFTESAAYIYSQLSPEQKQEFIQRHFSRDKGIGYTFGRTHINSCDFAIDIYTYVEDNDRELATFSLARDKKYILPFLKDALAYTKEPLVLFASPWSPPFWMKENESPIRGGALKEDCKPIWAKYYAKYIKAMAEEGVTISAISVQNEPNARQPWESCSYTPEQEREFVEKYLAPTLDAEGLSHIKIIIWDHNKERVYDRARKVFESAAVRQRVWAVGHHWYSGDHFDGPRLVHEQFGKTLLSTEICCPIDLAPLEAAERYGKELMGDFNNFTAGFCDWNMILSTQGGPFHNRNEKTVATAGVVFEDKSKGCYAPVLWDAEKKEVIYTPIHYYIGHFSKYVLPGAVRVATTRHTEEIQTCAFKNPDGGLVLILLNTTGNTVPAVIRHNELCTRTDLPPHSMATAFI